MSVESPVAHLRAVAAAAQDLDGAAAEDILRWTVERFGPDVGLSCSFGGPSSLVMVDMLAQLGELARVEVYYIDTGVLFAATHALRRRVEDRYGVQAVRYGPDLTLTQQAAAYGPELWARDPDACCALRKVAPNDAALRGKRAWIAGLRRDQSPSRRDTPVLAWDEGRGLATVNPLAPWTEDEVWDYIRRHDVPYNELHDHGYPSLGCTVCTSPVVSGEDLRAGRWRGKDKIECGLHQTM